MMDRERLDAAVEDIDQAVLDAIRTVRSECAEICRLCLLANRMDLAPAMIAAEVMPIHAKRRLEELRAATPAPPNKHNGTAAAHGFDLRAIERGIAEQRAGGRAQ